MKGNVFKSCKGGTMVLVALCFVILLGFAALAVDAGYMYSEKAKLQTAADAAALAGAYRLLDADPAGAESKAIGAANSNGVKTSNIEIVDVDLANKEITVAVIKDAALFFAPVLGKTSAEIKARAKAKIGAVNGFSGLIPIGIAEEYWNSIGDGHEFQIKFDSGKNNDGDDDMIGSGNYCAVDFTHQSDEPNNPGSDYREFLKNGYPGLVSVGDIIYTEPGVKVGPTRQGIESHKGEIVFAPLVDTFVDKNGKECLSVVGFAVIRISESKTKNGKIFAEKIERVIIDDSNKSPWSNMDYGLWSIKLVE